MHSFESDYDLETVIEELQSVLVMHGSFQLTIGRPIVLGIRRSTWAFSVQPAPLLRTIHEQILWRLKKLRVRLLNRYLLRKFEPHVSVVSAMRLAKTYHVTHLYLLEKWDGMLGVRALLPLGAP